MANTNLLLTEREGRNGEYWPEVVAVRAKTTEGQYFPVRLELAGLVSNLLHSTRAKLVLNLPAFENKKHYTAYDRFHGNGPYGEIPTKKELGLTSRSLCHIVNNHSLIKPIITTLQKIQTLQDYKLLRSPVDWQGVCISI